MTDLPVWVEAFRSKFNDPYFGPRSTKKSNIWGIFFHGFQQTHQKSFKSVMVMSGDHVDLAWNHPFILVLSYPFKILNISIKVPRRRLISRVVSFKAANLCS